MRAPLLELRIEPHRSKLPLERPQFEEAPTLAGEEPLNYDRMQNCALIPPGESHRSNLPQNQAFVRM